MSEAQLQAKPNAGFGGLLKSWRSSRKMSQLDLSLHSDVSQRHLSFLESGRAKPSQQMVMQLSDALDVPLRERNTLLQAAGFAPLYRQRTLDDESMNLVRDALERTLRHHEPYPAIVIDREYNLMLQNDAFERLIRLFGDPDALWQACCPDGTPNLFRLTFHPDGARPLIRNFNDIAPILLQRAWRESLANKSPVTDFIEELRQDPDIPAQWYVPDPMTPPAPVLSLVMGQGDLELSLFTMISTFGTPADITTDELRVETFFPANPETEQLLRSLGPH